MKRKGMTVLFDGHRHLLAMAMFGISGGVVAAPLWYEAGDVDTSKWACKYCPLLSGVEGDISLGVVHVSNDEYNFGNYTGLDKQGNYGIYSADLFYRDDDANYWKLNANRLGLDTRSVDFEGGQQGRYSVRLDYQEIPRLYTDTALTPFSGVGGETLRLPGTWIEAGTTGAMVQLDSSLHPVELRTDRYRLGAGLNFTPDEHWTYFANFKHEKKEGLKRIGGSFLFTSTLLPEPVDYTTEQVELGLGYRAEKWQMQLGYLGSFFHNDHKGLRWDNPFIAPVGNANEGQLAQPPGNTFHQLMLTGNYRFSSATQASVRIAKGQMLQDEPFLPYTINPALATTPLPRDSLDGEVRLLTVDARLSSALTDKFTLQTDLRYNERDNHTPVDTYDIVSTDAFLAGPRSNQLYNHTDRTVKLSGHYRPSLLAHFSGGVDYQEKQRSDAEVEETQETTLWLRMDTHPDPGTDMSVGIAHADRDASDYRPLANTVAPQNPLMVKFNLAAREQQRLQTRISITPFEQLNVGMEFIRNDNDYKDTSVGLLSSTDDVLTFDATLLVTKSVSFHAFFTNEKHDNEQAGSQNFSLPDWFATSEDIIYSQGLGAAWRPVDEQFELGVDYVHSAATGRIELGSGTPFPDLRSRINSTNAHALYRLSESFLTELSLFYETFSSDDWSVDNVDPATIPSVLTLGSASTDYHNRAVILALHYRF